MSDYAKCKWCGRSFEKGGFSKFLSKNTAGLAGKESYCSEKCRQEAESNNPSSGGQPSGSSNTGVFGKITNAIDNSTERKEARLEARVDSIASMDFGSSPDEISNGLKQLVTMGSGTKDNDIKKAIAEKMEFMILQLRKAGNNQEADFFEVKRKKIKPKWWD